MKISAQLKKHGILPIREMGAPGVYDLDCPKPYCKEYRSEKGDTAMPLKVTVQEGFAKWHCSHCHFTGHVGVDPAAPVASPEPTAEAPQEAPNYDGAWSPQALKYLQDLGIAVAAGERGVKWVADRSSIGFPYLDQHGKPINMMLMKLPELTTRMASSAVYTFYGLDRIQPGNDLVIVQGEVEKLIFDTCGIEGTVAIPNSGNFMDDDEREFDYLSHAAELFKFAPRIIIATDNTPEGDRHRREIIRRMGAAKCFNVQWARGTARRTFRELGIDATCGDVRDAKAVPIVGLHEINSFLPSLLMFFRVGMARGVSTGFPNLDEFLTIAGGRVTAVTGMPGMGKSEVLDAITMNLSEMQGWKHAIFSPENRKEEHVVKLVEKRVLATADPRKRSRMSEETFLSGAEWVGQYYYFIHSESLEHKPTVEWIVERAQDAVLRYGVRNVIIDPWNRIKKPAGKKENDRDYIAEALTHIIQFAINHDVHVFLVVHPTKQEKDKKTKKFDVPSLYSMSGSADFVNMVDNGFVVQRSQGADNDITEIHINKVRSKYEGSTGICYLRYNTETGRFAPREEEHAQYSFDTKFKPDFDDDSRGIKTYEAE